MLSSRQDSEMSSPRGKVHHIVTTLEEDAVPNYDRNMNEINTQRFEDKRKMFEYSERTAIMEEQNGYMDKFQRNGEHIFENERRKSPHIGKLSSTDTTKMKKDSFQSREYSSDRQRFSRDNKEYERLSDQQLESAYYPRGDDRHTVQKRQYIYETKEYPVSTQDNSSFRVTTRNNKSTDEVKNREDEDDHQYENVEFTTTTIHNKTETNNFKSRSYISPSDAQPELEKQLNGHLDQQEIRVNNQNLNEARNVRAFSESQSFTQFGSDRTSRRGLVTNGHAADSVDPARVSVSGSAVRLVGVHENAEFSLTAPQILREEDVIVEIIGKDSAINLDYQCSVE